MNRLMLGTGAAVIAYQEQRLKLQAARHQGEARSNANVS
jgi:hypothetical protein